ncbi:MAG TPA: DUF3106 domain-containing protein [Verrucomicrobiae bacterium]|nr:DUF3106 domain-containing protein [Verrucomicrobiae bacterium]
MKTWPVILFLLSALSLTAAEPPMPPSPIAEFRTWLKSSPAERQVALAKRSPGSRARIEEKIAEYMALPPVERELKLSATEFQWYLKPLLKTPAGATRDASVAKVPPLWQPMIMKRLGDWDRMPANLKKDALDHELVVEYLSTPPHKQEAILRSLTTEERSVLMQRLGGWEILPAAARARVNERLREFFELEPQKQQEALNNFSDSERKSIEQTLQAFRGLTRAQQELCITSFGQFAAKFAAMDRPDQIAFLKNVDRWQEMSQQERDTWRKVVAIVPPMPPLPLPPPPMPGGQRSSPSEQ